MRPSIALCVLALAGCAVEDEPSVMARPLEDTSVILRAFCTQLEACECYGDRKATFLNQSLCEELASNAEVELTQALVADSELFYDADCLGDLAARLQGSVACDEPLFDGCACKPVYGAETAGESCSVAHGVSACGPGLECLDGVCKDVCGEPAAAGESCELVACSEGLHCLGGTCAIVVDDDEPGPQTDYERLCFAGACPPTADCRVDDGERRCNERRADGEACNGHSLCASLFCPAGFCERAPGSGEECRLGRCDHGLVCDGGFCQPDPDAVCYPMCEAGTACEAGQCVAETLLPELCTERLPYPGFQ